jgi:hypothetical protein
MYRKRLSALAAVTGLAMLVLAVSPAGAWEFTMGGSFGWELEFLGQTGRSGFFGPYDVDAGSGAAGTVVGQFAPYNLWHGQPSWRMVSGTDSSWQTQYLSSNMDLRMNKALRVRGLYYIGEWTPGVPSVEGFQQDARGNLPASEYLSFRFPGIQQSFSPGYWNTLWLTADLPWGILSVGKRPNTFGMGLGWNGDFTRSTESFSLSAPYGPLRIGLSFYPSRRAFTDGTSYYNQDYDKNDTRIHHITAQMTYKCGPMDAGVRGTFVEGHRGGEGKIVVPATRNTGLYRDRDDFYGAMYLKYYTGMLFFNAEVDWYQRTDRNRRKTAAGAPAPNVRDTYVEHWRWAIETSALSGPARLGLLYAWLSGGDRRNGAQIDRNGIIRTDTFSNTGLFRPYSYLMVYSYGLGNFIDTTTTYGYAEDASVYGARLDYSVAANLNMYGTFFWADRASKSGFGWGAIAPNPTLANGEVQFGPSAPDSGAGPTGAPNIPDTNLGWEVDLGMDWKLIEGLNVLTTLAYWQPGNWFKYACVDKSVPGWGAITQIVGPAPIGLTGNDPVRWGINPDRAIDPIWGLRIVVSGEF